MPIVRISVDDLQKGYIDELPRNKTILCVCSNGLRAMRAQAVLLLNGYPSAHLEGGIEKLIKDV